MCGVWMWLSVSLSLWFTWVCKGLYRGGVGRLSVWVVVNVRVCLNRCVLFGREMYSCVNEWDCGCDTDDVR